MSIRSRRIQALAGGILTGIAGGFALGQLPAFSDLNGGSIAVLIGLLVGIGVGMMAAAIVRDSSS